MTTIAYKNGIIAADRLVHSGEIGLEGFTDKVVELKDGSLVAVSGVLSALPLIVEWLNGKRKSHKKPYFEKDSIDVLLLHPDGRLQCAGHNLQLFSFELIDDCAAIGSGGRIALGAMLAGKSAAEAVELACRIDLYSGGDVKAWRCPAETACEDQNVAAD